MKTDRKFHTLGMYNQALTMTTDGAYLILEGVSPCSDRCHWAMTTDRAYCIYFGWITMLCPLSWDDENWWSMLHTLGTHYHSPTVAMERWQLTEHVSWLRNTLPSPDRCYQTMPTGKACFILEGVSPCSERCHGTMTTDRAHCIP